MKELAKNKKAGFDYEILEKFEAGLVLNGQEAKSIKTRGLSLAGSYVIVRPDGVFWIGAKIPPYQPANAGADYNERRDRQVLLRRAEIRRLVGIAAQKGLTFVPIRLYTKQRYQDAGKIKLEFAVCRGKKKFDKRQALKTRAIEREIARSFGKI